MISLILSGYTEYMRRKNQWIQCMVRKLWVIYWAIICVCCGKWMHTSAAARIETGFWALCATQFFSLNSQEIWAFFTAFWSYYSGLGVGWLRFFKYFEKFWEIDVFSALSQNFSKYSKNRDQPTPSHPLYNYNTAYKMVFGCELVEKNWSAHFLTTGEYMHVLYKLRRGDVRCLPSSSEYVINQVVAK